MSQNPLQRKRDANFDVATRPPHTIEAALVANLMDSTAIWCASDFHAQMSLLAIMLFGRRRYNLVIVHLFLWFNNSL